MQVCSHFKRSTTLAPLLLALSVATAAAFAQDAPLQCLPSGAIDCSTGLLSHVPGISSYNQIFKSACVTHDYCYRYGAATYGTTKKRCDKEFKTNMQRICDNTTLTDWLTLGLSKGACHGAALSYFGAVSNLGDGAFRSSSSGTVCEYAGPAANKTCGPRTKPDVPCWTTGFSEESGGSKSCPVGKAAAGLWCTGRYCDNKHIFCKPVQITATVGATKWISEEQPNASFRVDDRSYAAVVVGLECKGSYCDNLRAQVGRSDAVRRTGAWRWTTWFSEEGWYRQCNENEFMTGVGCKGKYCDNLSLHCSTFVKR